MSNGKTTLKKQEKSKEEKVLEEKQNGQSNEKVLLNEEPVTKNPTPLVVTQESTHQCEKPQGMECVEFPGVHELSQSSVSSVWSQADESEITDYED